MKNYKKWAATLGADLFLIFAVLWTFGQLVDEISRKNFLGIENILILIFPFLALFLNGKIFRSTAVESEPKATQTWYVSGLLFGVAPVVLVPFTLGFSISWLVVTLPVGAVVMLAAWVKMTKTYTATALNENSR